MAKYQVECPVCEEAHTVQLYGKNSDREYKLENWDWTCDECAAKALAIKSEKESREAAEANAEAALPDLVGSEKQVAWAETIRAKILDGVKVRSEKEYKEAIARLEKAGQVEEAETQAEKEGFKSIRHAWECQNEAISRVINNSSAHWWIENRSKSLMSLAMDISKEVAKESGVEDNTKEAAEAKAEATVRPEQPITETVAEIIPTKNSVKVVFPEKREDFWQIIKKQLGYTWQDGCWLREAGSTTTAVADMAAEAGNVLLAAGFIVQILDNEIRDNAISGNYTPDTGRWIAKRASGDYAGWFAINWREKSDSLYQAARRLTGSKWSNPSVVVRAEHFEQVLDFAEMYEFNLSVGAQELADNAQLSKNDAMTARVKSVDRELPQPGTTPPHLDVPSSVDVADEFKD